LNCKLCKLQESKGKNRQKCTLNSMIVINDHLFNYLFKKNKMMWLDKI
jgi:hypothetical protein